MEVRGVTEGNCEKEEVLLLSSHSVLEYEWEDPREEKRFSYAQEFQEY